MRSNIRQLLTLLLIFIATNVNSQTFVGNAVDKMESNAKKLAIADLQQNLYVQVETKSYTTVNSNRPNYYRLTSKLSSTLPILGAQPDCLKKNGEYHCEVSLNQESAKLYRASIDQKFEEIDESWLGLQKANATKRYDGLRHLHEALEKIKPSILVYRLLSPDNPVPKSQQGVSPSLVQNALHEMQKNPTSIEMLALAIAEQYEGKQRVFVKPLSVYNSLEVTPFAKTLHNYLQSRLNTINDKDYAYFVLSGNYRFDNKEVQVQTTLTSLTREDQGLIAGATTNTIALQHIGQLQLKPKELSFDQLLQQGQIVSNELTAKLHTNKGHRDLLFTKGQSIKLLVKVNQPSYYYLLGHNTTEQNSASYLLDLNDAQGPDKFIQYLGHDQVNRWVEIGEFEVHPPFGVETLQLFASASNPSATIPPTQFDGTYYKVGGEREQVVNKTRGLVRKRKSNQSNKVKTQVAEAVIRFTTAAN